MHPVRPGEVQDIPQLVELNALVQEDHIAAEPEVFKPARPEEVASWFADGLRTGLLRVWVAVDQDELVGYLTVNVQERVGGTFTSARTWWEVDQLGVRRDRRRRGVARALLAAVAEAAVAAGIDDLELTTWSFNTSAQEAWQRLGFRPRITRYAIDPRKLKA